MQSSEKPATSEKAEEVSFVEDDEAFRAVTTLLNLLSFELPLDSKKVDVMVGYDKFIQRQLEILSILLANHEGSGVCATMFKVQPGKYDVFVEQDNEPYVAQNPVDGNAAYLKVTPDVNRITFRPELGIALETNTSIAQFLWKNWYIFPTDYFASLADVRNPIRNMSFVGHVETVCKLVQIAHSNKRAWTSLARYCLFVSGPKIRTRIKGNKLPADYFSIMKATPLPDKTRPIINGPKLTTKEWNFIVWLYEANCTKESTKDQYPLLNKAVEDSSPPPELSVEILVEYHTLILIALKNLTTAINKVCRLKGQRSVPKEEKIQRVLDEAYKSITALSNIAWRSELFSWYLHTYQKIEMFKCSLHGINTSGGISTDSPTDGAPQNTDSPTDSAPKATDPSPSSEFQILETLDGSNPSLDFEAALPPPSANADSMTKFASDVQGWLRLVTSVIYYSQGFSKQPQTTVPEIKCRVLECPEPGNGMAPWRSVVRGLFSKEDQGEKAVEYLVGAFGEKPGNVISNDNYRFVGRAHCEAIMACTHFAAHNKERYPNHRFDPDVLVAFEKSPPFIAPSKRCCPVCAYTLKLLSKEAGPSTNYRVPHRHKTSSPWTPRLCTEIALAVFRQHAEGAFEGVTCSVSRHRNQSCVCANRCQESGLCHSIRSVQSEPRTPV
jgi:hypothetical protein